MACVSAMTAPFDTEYVVNPRGRSAEMDDTFTMAPPSPDSIMAGIANLLVRNMDVTFTADIVVPTVERAPEPHRARGDSFAGALVGHVGTHIGSGAAGLFDHLRCSSRALGLTIDHQDARSRTRQQNRCGATVADAVGCRAASGNYRNLAVEAGLLRYLHYLPMY